MTKWTNLRNVWIRTNKNDEKKSGSGAKSSKPYVYKEQMDFLRKVARPNPPQESVASRISQPGTEGSTQLSENSQPSTSKRQKTMPPEQHIMDLDVKMSEFLDSRLSQQTDPPILSFFKGILPSVTSFDDDETLELQSGVLSLIQQIKKKREKRLYANNYNYARDSTRRSGYSTQNYNYLSTDESGYSSQNQAVLTPHGSGYARRQTYEEDSPAASTWSESTDLNFSDF